MARKVTGVALIVLASVLGLIGLVCLGPGLRDEGGLQVGLVLVCFAAVLAVGGVVLMRRPRTEDHEGSPRLPWPDSARRFRPQKYPRRRADEAVLTAPERDLLR